MAVDVLLSKGVPEERILFLNLIASPEGVTGFAKRFPKLRVVTAFVDQGLDEKKCEYPLFPKSFPATNQEPKLHCSGAWGFWRPLLHFVIVDKTLYTEDDLSA